MFKSEFDGRVEVVHEILHGLELFGDALEDQEDVVYESLLGKDCPDKGLPDGLFVTAHEEVGVWWGRFGSHGCADKLEQVPVHE